VVASPLMIFTVPIQGIAWIVQWILRWLSNLVDPSGVLVAEEEEDVQQMNNEAQ